MTTPPVKFAWDGEAMTPSSQHMARIADQHFVIGEEYQLIEFKDRSFKSHNHYFACIADAWSNLPDALLDEYSSAEHLRKKALIRTGFCDERSIVCASKAEALRVASFIKPMDDYAIVVAREAVVTVYTAKSQSMRAMGAADFQKSKEAVFAFIDNLLGVSPGSTEREAGKAA